MKIRCKTCNKIFEAKPYYVKKGRKYCSHRCYWESLKESLRGINNPHYKGKVNKKCPCCGKIFQVYPNPYNMKRVFCNLSCYRKTVIIPDRVCVICGKSYHTNDRKGNFCSRECYRLYRLKYPIRYWLGKKRENLSREKNPAWKGGVTSKIRLLRSTTEFKEWRKKVYERDNYTCQICFQKRSGVLEPHHKKPIAYYPELVFDINNGITLCIDCHKKIDKWRR